MFRLLPLLLAIPLLYVGFVQTFWGNDPYLGWFISLIAAAIAAQSVQSDVRQPDLSRRKYYRTMLLLFFLIMWISLGVGELSDKTDMMRRAFPTPNITGI